MAPVVEIWGVSSTSSWPLLPGLLWLSGIWHLTSSESEALIVKIGGVWSTHLWPLLALFLFLIDLVSLFNGISTLVGNLMPKQSFLEDQLRYYLTHSWRDKGFMPFPRLSVQDLIIQHFSFYPLKIELVSRARILEEAVGVLLRTWKMLKSACSSSALCKL